VTRKSMCARESRAYRDIWKPSDDASLTTG
jgi:hypothetical protein